MTPSCIKEALTILDYLNRVCRTRYGPRLVTPIAERLEMGATTEECQAVIDLAWRQVQHKPEWRCMLRPAKLFGTIRFDEFLGELPPPKPVRDPLQPPPTLPDDEPVPREEVKALLASVGLGMTMPKATP